MSSYCYFHIRNGIGYIVILVFFAFSNADSSASNSLAAPSHLSDSIPSSGTLSDTSSQVTSPVLADTIRHEIRVRDTRHNQVFVTPSDIAIVKVKEYQGAGKNIAEILSSQSGIQTKKYGGVGSFQTVSLRGIPGSKVAVFLDDMQLNSIDGSAVDLSKISPSLIDNITVYKGITPAAFGGNSIGGAVVLKTPSRVDSLKGDIIAGAGSYGHMQSAIALFYPIPDLKLADGYTNISYESAENDFRYLDRNGTGNNTADDVYRDQRNAQYRGISALSRIRLPMPKYSSELAATIRYQQSHQGLPRSEQRPAPTAALATEGLDVVVHGKNTKFIDKGFVLRGNLGYTGNVLRYSFTDLDKVNSQWGSLPIIDIGTQENRALFKSNLMWFSPGEFCIIDASLVGRYTEIVPKSFTKEIAVNPQANNNEVSGSAAVDATINPLQWASIIIAGQLEGVHMRANSTRDFMPTTFFVDSLNGEGNFHYQSGRIGVWASPHTCVKAYMNVGTYYRRPTLMERYGSNGTVMPNPHLHVEKGTTVDGGVKIKTAHFFGDVALFSTLNSQAISLLTTPQGMVARNLDEARISGLECNVGTSLFHDKLGIEAQSTLQNPLCRTIYANQLLKQIPNEPVLSGTFRTTLSPLSFLSLNYVFSYSSPVFFDYPNTLQRPSVFTHDAKITALAGPRLSVILAINNITNVFFYGDAYGSNPFPGRGFFGTLSYTL